MIRQIDQTRSSYCKVGTVAIKCSHDGSSGARSMLADLAARLIHLIISSRPRTVNRSQEYINGTRASVCLVFCLLFVMSYEGRPE